MFYVWWRNVVSYQRFALPTFIASLGEPLLYLVAMGVGLGSYMGLINGMSYLDFIAPGLIVSSAMFAATYECTFGSYVRMTMEKVYNAQIVTPVSVEEIISGEVLWGMTRSFISGIIMVIVLLLFGVLHSWTALLLPFLWLTIGFLFSSMAMVMTSIAPNFDFFTYYMELFITPMFFFSGIFFPMDYFPQIVKAIALLLPLTHAVSISRAFVYGQLSSGVIVSFIVLLVPAFCFFMWALYQMKKRLIK